MLYINRLDSIKLTCVNNKMVAGSLFNRIKVGVYIYRVARFDQTMMLFELNLVKLL